MSSLIRKFNPKAIPWPGSVFYDKLSRTSMFQDNFKLLARDIAGYCDTGRLLDVGTGPGWLLIHLHRVSPLYRLYGIDTSPSIIEKRTESSASKSWQEKLKFKREQSDRSHTTILTLIAW